MLDRQRLDALLERLWDQALTAGERAELEETLRATPRARDIFWEQAMWQAAMRTWGEAEWGRRESLRRPEAVEGEIMTSSRDPHAGGRLSWAALWGTIILSCATAIGAASWWIAATQPATRVSAAPDAIDSRHLAIITSLSDPAWRDEAFVLGQGLSAGRLAIESGSVEITFACGARVLLRGPAEFGVLSSLRGELVRGDLAAHVPPGAEGFVVDTPSVEVVDLGTTFAVRVEADGTADVRVFEGAVEARADSEAADVFTRLEQNMARRFLPQGGPSLESPALFDEFPMVEPDAADRPRTAGAVKLLRAPPARLLGLESDDFILMFKERSAVRAPADCLVDIAKPGIYGVGGQRPPKRIGHDALVDSYLLHFDALPKPNPQRPRDGRGAEMRLEGSVTFTRPIVGVMCHTTSLEASDDVIGPLSWQYPSQDGPFRGIEPHDFDKLVVSGDRKTLSVSLLVRAQKGRDQIRVFVESE